MLVTTIRCYDDNCCGCLDANKDDKGDWIFKCNECGVEWGRGTMEEIQVVDDIKQ